MLEISPQVVEAAHLFDDENHRALADPRTRLIVGDGRTHLLLTRERYDVIVSEPSNPWMAGIASLFTREFFQAARDRLAPGGVLCQWAHTYDISTRDLQSIVATFAVRVSRWDALADRRRRRPAGGIERAARAAPGARQRGLGTAGRGRRPRVGGRDRAVSSPVALRGTRAAARGMVGWRARPVRQSGRTGVLRSVERARSRAGRQRGNPARHRRGPRDAAGGGRTGHRRRDAGGVAEPRTHAASRRRDAPGLRGLRSCHRGQSQRRSRPGGLDRSVRAAPSAGGHAVRCSPASRPTRRTCRRS